MTDNQRKPLTKRVAAEIYSPRWSRYWGCKVTPRFDWTPEAVDQMTGLWMAGRSAGQIAVAMGMTRNSVIGKVHRLGIKRGCALPEPKAAKPAPRRAAPFAPPVAPPPPVAFAAPSAPIREPEIAFVPPPNDLDLTGAALAFHNLAPRGCKFPIGDPLADDDFRFCNEVRKPGDERYCAAHAKLCRGQGSPSERRALQGYQLGSFKKRLSIAGVHR